MEKAADGSNLRRPSAIPRFPRPATSQVNSKLPSSQLPVKHGLSIPKTRLRTHQEKIGTSAVVGNSHSEVVDQSKTEEDAEASSTSDSVPVDRFSSQSSQNSPPPQSPQHGLDSHPKLMCNPQRTNHDRDEETENRDNGSEFAPQKPSAATRRPRMSLSDRTIETLSQIPPSPSPRRRKSGFYPVDYPASSFSRPISSLSQSRPNTNGNLYPELSTPRRLPAKTYHAEAINGSHSVKPAINRRSVSSFVPRSAPRSQIRSNNNVDVTPSKPPPVPTLPKELFFKWSDHGQPQTIDKSGTGTTSGQPRSQINSREPSQHGAVLDRDSKQRFRSKTCAPKSIKQRPHVADFFSQPPPKAPDVMRNRFGTQPPKLLLTSQDKASLTSSTTSKLAVHSRILGKANGPTTSVSGKSLEGSPKSSTALRDTIAKAKAARRAAAKHQEGHEVADPQKFQLAAADEKVNLFGTAAEVGNVLRKRINVARTTGRLNISALGLDKFPEEVNTMYDLETIEVDQGEWYESVDLIRLVAADNDLEILEDWVFPDISTEIARDLDDEFRGNIFRGLETLDLHGNRLSTLAAGLQRLERLATLNLSKNRLTNGSLDVLGNINSLRELRLSENLLEGDCLGSLTNLKYLEVLDLRDNLISSLSANVTDLIGLRVLVLAGNKLKSIPFEFLQSLPLIEVDISRNRLDGFLISYQVDKLPVLKSMDVSNNLLTSVLEDEATVLPLLQVLNVTENRLCGLPDVSSWTELVTLSAAGNRITDLPKGLTSLEKLRNLDFTHNNLKALDNDIGLMENLSNLCIANNPLRERRHLTLTTEDLKSELRSRLLPTDHSEATSHEEVPPETSILSSQVLKKWPSTISGILDCSSTSLQSLTADDLDEILASSPVKSFLLHHNKFTQIPPAIALMQSTLTTLDLAHNHLSASPSYLSSQLDLPHLTTLSLASNALPSLSPILTFLTAPLLSTINVSHNRLSSLPPFRKSFPALTAVLASENQIADLRVDTVRGLHILDVASNEIAHLRPELGLLEAGELRELVVWGNRFRVPRREVLEKGTDAVLAWLRGKVVDM